MNQTEMNREFKFNSTYMIGCAFAVAMFSLGLHMLGGQALMSNVAAPIITGIAALVIVSGAAYVVIDFMGLREMLEGGQALPMSCKAGILLSALVIVSANVVGVFL